MSNWNRAPYVKGRGYVPNPIARHGIPKYADTVRNPKVKGTLDWQKFWEEQLYYIHNGYETGGMHLPGRYYYYSNYRIFNTVMGPIRPQIVDFHLDLAYCIDYCKANGRNFIGPKGRRLGVSEAGQTMVVDYGYRFFDGYKAGVAAGLDVYVQDFMQKWDDANAMTVPEFKIKTLLSNDEETVAGYKVKDSEGNVIEDGTKNIIYKRTMHTNPNMFKGLYLNDVVAEEMGEFEHAEEFYTATIDCLMFGEKQVGSMWMYGCVCAGTKVWNNNGDFINIEDLIPENGIVGFDGELASKENITYWQPPREKDCFRITTNTGRTLECSDDHPILVRRLKKKKYSGVEFKETKSLIPGDVLATIEKVDIWSDQRMFDPRLVGWLVGDGTYGDKQNATLCSADEEVWSYLEKKYTVVDQCDPAETKDDRFLRKARVLGVLPELEKLGIRGQTKDNKRLPINIHSFCKADVCNFIGGYFDADGCAYTNNKTKETFLKLTSANYEILNETRFLLQKIGIRSNIMFEKPNFNNPKTTRGHYNLIIKDKASVSVFYENISFHINRKQEKLVAGIENLKNANPRKSKAHKGLRFERIVSVEFIGQKPVYNLTAGTTNTYVANGIITHNTGGNMAKSSKAFQHVWHNSEAFNAERFFMPRTLFYFPYYGGASEGAKIVEKVPYLQHLEPYQRIGNPDIQAATEAILEKRKELLAAGDMKKYYEFCQNTALDIKEVFRKTVSNNFNVDKLNDQGFLIDSQPKKYGKWKLDWKKKQNGEVIIPRQVIATPAKDTDREEDCVLILHDGHPVKGYRGLFCAGVDSYDQDQSKTSKSLGAMVVRRKNNPSPNLENGQVVCLVRTRPARKEMFYETCAMVSVYYGMYNNTLVDIGKPAVIKHYELMGLQSYLAYRPKKFESSNSSQSHEYGVSINTYSKPLMVSLLQSYILDFTQTLWFPNIIDESLIYDEYEKDSDNDTVDALGISLMQEISDGSQPHHADDKEIAGAFKYPEHELDDDGNIVSAGSYDASLDVFEGDVNLTRSMKNQFDDAKWDE